MKFFCYGISYKTADISLLEKASMSLMQKKNLMHKLYTYPSISGVVVLTTCNRCEIYVCGNNQADLLKEVQKDFARLTGLSCSTLDTCTYTFEDMACFEHLLQVSTSLDAMVLGDQQIAGQVHDALLFAEQEHVSNEFLTHVFTEAMRVARLAQTKTNISKGHASVARLACDIAQVKCADLHSARVLILGSGTMSETCARYLAQLGVSSFFVSNRTYAHAKRLAEELNGKAFLLDKLDELIEQADILISCTAAPTYLLEPDRFAQLTHDILVFDLAMPRDIDPACSNNPHVELFALDTLETYARRAQQTREKAKDDVYTYIEQAKTDLAYWQKAHSSKQLIRKLHTKAEDIKQEQFDRLMSDIGDTLDEDQKTHIDITMQTIMRRLLDTPTKKLQESVDTLDEITYTRVLQELFELGDEK